VQRSGVEELRAQAPLCLWHYRRNAEHHLGSAGAKAPHEQSKSHDEKRARRGYPRRVKCQRRKAEVSLLPTTFASGRIPVAEMT
jgi:hypothetical protein